MAKYSTRKRADGRWEARWQDAATLGHGVRLSAYGPTRKAAIAALDAKVEKRGRRLDLDKARDWTVRDYLAWWTGEELAARVADGTLADTSRDAYTRVSWEIADRIGTTRLADLGPAHIRRLLDDARADGRSNSRRARLHQVASIALACAVRYEMIPSNPATKVTPPKVDRKPRVTATVDDARRFLEAADQDRLAAYWRLMLSVPLRPGEPVAVAWEDDAFDLDAGTYRVAHNLARVTWGGKRMWARHDTKGHRDRTVPLPAATVAALRRHKVMVAEERLAGIDRQRGRWVPQPIVEGGRVRELRPVFPTVSGRWYWPTMIRRDLARLCDEAGTDTWAPHDLRRVAVTLLTGAGVHPRVVQQMAGHSSVTMTDVYTGALNQQMREAVEAVGAALA